MVMAHAGVITVQALLLSITGGVIVFGTMLGASVWLLVSMLSIYIIDHFVVLSVHPLLWHRPGLVLSVLLDVYISVNAEEDII